MSLSSRLERLERIAPQRSALEGEPFTFPEPSLEQFIDWIDSERIPDYLAAANGGWAHNARGWYPSKEYVEQHVAWCHKTLDGLQLAYEQGQIDADTYARLITQQDYSDDHLRELRRRAEYFMPSQLSVLFSRSDGRKVSRWTLRTGPGASDRRVIYLMGDQWVTFPENFKCWEEPGW